MSSISIANSRTSVVAESVSSSNILPAYIKEGSYKIVRLVKDYYDYLNSLDNPDHELKQLLVNHDVDDASEKYLDAIQAHIAKNVPNSTYMNRKRLYKIIYQYYKTRGSEDSIYAFFKIFFNEIVTVIYPGLRLIESSSERSKSSDIYVLQDSYYWQRFSYQISSTQDPAVWKNPFLKFVHPAGLKLFLAFVIILTNSNNWKGSFEEYINNLEHITPDEYWQNINWDALRGYHTPRFQANVDYDLDFVLKVLHDELTGYRTLTYPIPNVSSEYLRAAMISILIEIVLQNNNTINSNFRSSYQQWLKFYDSSSISDGYADKTINQASSEFLPINECRFESVGTYSDLPGWTSGEIVYDDLINSYVDIVDVGTETDWINSTIENVSSRESLFISAYIPEYYNITV